MFVMPAMHPRRCVTPCNTVEPSRTTSRILVNSFFIQHGVSVVFNECILIYIPLPKRVAYPISVDRNVASLRIHSICRVMKIRSRRLPADLSSGLNYNFLAQSHDYLRRFEFYNTCWRAPLFQSPALQQSQIQLHHGWPVGLMAMRTLLIV